MTRTRTTSITGIPLIEDGLESYAHKKARVKQELKAAGLGRYGMSKFNSRYLHKIIHDDEHIRGVIYGRFTEGPGLLSWVDRMVVATDRRIISLNHKPGYTDIDEFTYDIVDGVDVTSAGPFAAVKLNTKAGHFAVRFVNPGCAEKFMHYIEKRRLEYFEAKAGSFNLQGGEYDKS